MSRVNGCYLDIVPLFLHLLSVACTALGVVDLQVTAPIRFCVKTSYFSHFGRSSNEFCRSALEAGLVSSKDPLLSTPCRGGMKGRTLMRGKKHSPNKVILLLQSQIRLGEPGTRELTQSGSVTLLVAVPPRMHALTPPAYRHPAPQLTTWSVLRLRIIRYC